MNAPAALPSHARAPGPRGLPLLGNALSMGGSGALPFYLRVGERYGDVVGLSAGPLPVFVLRNPEHLHHVLVKNQSNYKKGLAYDGLRLLLGQGLVTSEGDLWRTQRRLMQPSFTPKAITQFFAMMVEVTEQMLARWQQRGDVDLVIDDEMTGLTMSIISRALFGVDLGTERNEVGEALREAFAFIPKRTMNAVGIPLGFPLPSHLRFRRAMRTIDDFVRQMIAAGRARGAQQGDALISLLLAARDEEGGGSMSEAQLHDEILTLFFAGFETTARTLTWAIYLLARHPEVQTRLRDEARTVLGERSLGLDQLFALTYTRMVADETLRLYPPTALLARQAVSDDEIGGYRVPEKSLIILVPYAAHRHSSLWPDPERFDPERFAPEAVAARPKYAFIPFASGPRICIGNNFALMEMNVALAMLARRFSVTMVDPRPLGAQFAGTMRPDRDLVVRLGPAGG
ncbi:MAG TPA: cytochrome P450 [Polyangia bacterium]